MSAAKADANKRRGAVRSFRTAGAEKVKPSTKGKAWGAASAVLTQAAHAITSPLSVHYYPEATAIVPERPPGLANMKTHVISIDSELVGGDPSLLSKPLTAEQTIELEALMGVLFHEAGHLAHTYEITRKGWLDPDTGEKLKSGARAQLLASFATVLEEPRMEARVVESHPRTRSYLRSCANHLIVSNLPDRIDSVSSVIRTLTLVYGRTVGGSLQSKDAAPAVTAAEEACGTKTVGEIQTLIAKAVAVKDLDAPAELPRIAEELIKLLPESEKADEGSMTLVVVGADGLGPASNEIPEGPAGGGAGEEVDSPLSQEEAEALAEAVKEAIADAVEEEAKKASEGSEGDGEFIADELEKIAEEIRNGGPAGAMNKGSGGLYPGRASGQIPEPGVRPATALEVAVARRLCAELRKARGKQLRSQGRVTPPGRFRARGALTQAVERRRGAVITGTAYQDKQVVKDQLWAPECGLIVDTSGSMGHSAKELGSVIWVLQEAITQMGGSFSAALFGNGDKVIVHGGQRLLQVPDIQCQGGSDYMPKAIESMRQNLRLEDQRRPRILLMVTDGMVCAANKAAEQVKELRDRNVTVLQGNFSDQYSPVGVETVQVLESTLAIADVLGKACVAELNRNSRARR